MSKWERGLSVPDSEMLISLSEVFEVSVSTLLGENIPEIKAGDLNIISEKLEVINLQLAQRKDMNRKILHGILIVSCVAIVSIFIGLLVMSSSYLNWDYGNPELATAGVLIHGFEWIFMRICPFAFVSLVIGIVLTRRKTK